MSNATILIVEDDSDILRANRSILELEGYTVYCADTLAKGRERMRTSKIDLILLDILLPDGSGLELCRELRGKSDVRILFLSALNTKNDVINGLRAGGDDYLAKPYLTEELLLRVEALLRRGPMMSLTSDAGAVRIGPFTCYPLAKQVYADGRDLRLKPLEYAVLALLLEGEGEYYEAENIYKLVWNAEPLTDLSPVHNQIYHLRGKLKPFGVGIEYKRNQGYRITWPE